MKFNFRILIISTFILVQTVSQELNCEYEDTTDFEEKKKITYTCRLNIHNPDGFDAFDRIPGTYDNEVNAIEKSVGVTKIIPSILCKQFRNLLILSLAEKEIEFISEEALRECYELGALYVSNNKISRIHVDAFEGTKKLVFLDLEANQLTELPDGIFKNLNELDWLSLSGNRLGDNLQSDLFKPLKSLQYLYLSNCEITEIKAKWFETTSQLYYLEMSNNRIRELPRDIFHNLNNMRHIIMAGNQIKILNYNSFGTLTYLKSLNFNDNSIEAIDESIFNHAKHMKQARLLNNACISVSIEIDAIAKENTVHGDKKYENFDECFGNFRKFKDEL
jgi:Leucine-rich repeat (LRR) protein